MADEQRVRHHAMPACVLLCVYSNDAFDSLCPGRASVESSMSSVKGFSGPASEKIKLFFIGHRRRSAFLMLTWTLAGTALRAVMLRLVCAQRAACNSTTAAMETIGN